MNETYDVIIVGGSYAGLSAAMALGRSLRKVLIIDGGRPCNAQTPHSHNFITQDGVEPASIARIAREQVLKYPTVQFREDTVVEADGESGRFQVKTMSENGFSASKLLFATGVRDIMPEIPGFAECWGISVIHCPYCHGYEVAGRKTGILANGETAIHLAKLIKNWTSDLTVLTNGPADFDENSIPPATARVMHKKLRAIEHENGIMSGMRFEDDSVLSLDALYARPAFEQHSDLPEKLGCALNEQGYIQVDGLGKTNVPGVFAAGDNSTFFRSVSMVTAAGTMAGASINHELIDEVSRPVARTSIADS